MGIVELTALAGLVMAVAGGAWNSLATLNTNISIISSDLRLVKWRLYSIERVLGIESKEVEND